MEELLPFEKVEREVLVKQEAETSEDYGKKPEDRSVEELISYGIVNLNKPSGPTSHQVSDYVKGILGIDKAGHSGTLDPGVTGVLPTALDKATRIVQALLKAGKEYVCLMRLHKELDEKDIKKACEKFIGKIKQMPPIKSAIKRQLREREIYYLNIYEIDGKNVLFKVGCEAGVYIRKLVHDIGQELGCGANMQQLVRTKAGPFKDDDWASLHDLKDAYEYWKDGNEEEIRKVINPIEFAVRHLPKIWVFDNVVDSLCHGAILGLPGISKVESGILQGDTVAVMSLKEELIGLGKAGLSSEDMLEYDKGIGVELKKIFMERGVYPKRVIHKEEDGTP